MGLPKAKINSNMANKLKKWLPMDELHMRQNRNLLQCLGIYVLHCLLGISFFYYFFFLKPHSLSVPLFFLLLAVAVKAPIIFVLLAYVTKLCSQWQQQMIAFGQH
jgi:hypothetical protein